LERFRREVAAAQQQFPTVEGHASAGGAIYVLVALQTAQAQVYTLSVQFPPSYPSVMPRVDIRKPVLTGRNGYVPHRYQDGQICFLHPSMWNPGRHHLTFVIARAAKWLNKYEVWLKTGKWPGKEVPH
jgi:hypothetical protein